MMRLPQFSYRAPRTVQEAARILAGEGPSAQVLAGGTDLLPNMKRRHQTPTTLVSLRYIEPLRKQTTDSGLTLGATVTLSEVVSARAISERYTALHQAAAQVATVHLRNSGTLGGNLCLDTRCSYYNQTYEWRKAIGFCMKKAGHMCWVATASKRCVAVSSTDTAPALIALGARIRLTSIAGERDAELAEFYNNDGIEHLTRRADEVLTDVMLPPMPGWTSTYWKLRRRGSFDFPELGVAAAMKLASDGTVEDVRVVFGASGSSPVVTRAAELLCGRRLTDQVIDEAARSMASRAKPVDNTDLDVAWRKHVASIFVGYAIKELRGDDMSAVRLRTARQYL
jgi:4-hydroxybenzoyl-CoA reductase subunit beta